MSVQVGAQCRWGRRGQEWGGKAEPHPHWCPSNLKASAGWQHCEALVLGTGGAKEKDLALCHRAALVQLCRANVRLAVRALG